MLETKIHTHTKVYELFKMDYTESSLLEPKIYFQQFRPLFLSQNYDVCKEVCSETSF